MSMKLKCINRALAMLLCTVMLIGVLSYIPIASAKNNDNTESRAVNFVIAMGIMSEDSYKNVFWDETPVKRSEMAKILCKMFNLEIKKDEKPVFSDVGESERPYVETIVRHGYMSGHGDGNFGAGEYVTLEQVVKIFVTVLGGAEVAENIGGYPTGYTKIGRKLDIVSHVKGDLSQTANRIDVANIIYDSMHAELYTLVSMGADKTVYDTNEGETFLSEYLDIYTGSGIVTENEVTSLNKQGGTDDNTVVINGNLYRDDDNLLNDYLGCDVVVYHKKADKFDEIGNIIYVEEGYKNKVTEIKDEDIISVYTRNIEYYNGNRKENVSISPIADMIYNGVAVAYDENRMKVNNGFVRLVDNNGDSKADVVIVYNYTPYIAEYVLSEDETISNMYAKDPIILKDNAYSITKNGLVAEFDDISKGDVILAAISENEGGKKSVKLDVWNETVVGEVSRMFNRSGKNYITVSNEDYEISKYCEELINAQYIPGVKAGDAGQFYLDSNKRIVYYNKNSFSGGIGYLMKSSVVKDAFSASISIRVYAENDEFITYSTKTKLIVNGVKYNSEDIADNEEIMTKLNTPQLIQYKVDNGVLTEIVFAQNGYDANNFSLDFQGTASCNYNSTLNDKYNVNADTKVFYVPRANISEQGKGDMLNKKYYYHVYTGSRFGTQNSYNLKMYDIQADNKVKYIVEEYDPSWGNITGGSAVLAVSEVGIGISSEGDSVKTVRGINESGNEVVINADYEYAFVDGTLNREIKNGDVIQYTTDFRGYIRGVKIQKNIDDAEYFGSTRMDPNDYGQKKAFGEVIYNNSSNILISGTKIHENMLPEETELYISNTGSAVFEYSMERKKYNKIAFSEITRGEKIFACVNSGNRTRMLIVYR